MCVLCLFPALSADDSERVRSLLLLLGERRWASCCLSTPPATCADISTILHRLSDPGDELHRLGQKEGKSENATTNSTTNNNQTTTSPSKSTRRRKTDRSAIRELADPGHGSSSSSIAMATLNDDALAELELLAQNQKKLNQLTARMTGILSGFDRRLASLEGTLLPIHHRTQTLNRVEKSECTNR